MPLYQFTIYLSSGKVITGCRFIKSTDIDLVFRTARQKCNQKYKGDLDKLDCIMVTSLSETYRTWWIAYRKLHPWKSTEPEWSVDMDPLEPYDPGDPVKEKRKK